MTYFIGLDGGGTKTKCIITDSKLNLLAENTGGASDFLLRGADIVSNELSDLIIQTVKKAGLSFNDIGFAVLGSTGAGREENALTIENELVKALKEKTSLDFPLKAISDAEIALEGAHEGKEGAILICGTGSILFAKNRNGEIFRTGGFGRILGDEGSGFILGREGLKLVAKYFDGIITSNLLIDSAKEHFSIYDSKDLIRKVYSGNIDIASFAPFVIEAAEHGDENCNAVIENQIDEVIMLIEALKRKAKMEKMNLSFIGGLITNKNYYSEKLRKSVEKVEGIVVKPSVYPPEIGAVIKAISFYNEFKGVK